MKKEDSALISDSEKDINQNYFRWFQFLKISRAIICPALILMSLLACELFGSSVNKSIVNEIQLKFSHAVENHKVEKYQLLLDFKKGDILNSKRVRQSIENLYKVGSFSNIEVSKKEIPGGKVDVYFNLSNRFILNSIKFKIKKHGHVFRKKSLRTSIFSLKRNEYFEEGNLIHAIQEIKNFLESRGFFNPEIAYELNQDKHEPQVDLIFKIKTGEPARINKYIITKTKGNIPVQFDKYLKGDTYIPYRLQEKIEEMRALLKKHRYYYPEIKYKPVFGDDRKTSVDLNLKILPGFQHEFKFIGMKPRMSLISTIWEKKVFEKWAKKESEARILYYLRNKGYLNARIQSSIKAKKMVKTITFTVEKNKRYTLGEVSFKGNKLFSTEKLMNLVKSNDLMFDKLFWLRSNSLLMDREVLKLFYQYEGFPSPKILMGIDFKKKKVDVTFEIIEGPQFSVESILFNGNNHVPADLLNTVMETKSDSPFVKNKFDRDIERLKDYYFSLGYDDVEISAVFSPGTRRSILIEIKEGRSFDLGNLIIIGASESQRKLIRKLFSLTKNKAFNRLENDRFRIEIENSSIFSEIKIEKIKREAGTIDLLVKVIPDFSKFYGLGIGYEERIGLRGTIEYLERNIFNSYSSLSAILQGGKNEISGVISYDTPFLFKSKATSSFKIRAENESYSSYKFYRYGVGESVNKRLTANSFILASLNWYRTKLTKLSIAEFGFDKLNVPFDTTALNFSYVKDARDNPLFPTRGHFFSTDIKVGIPLLEKNYSYLKFWWSYQRNFKFLKQGNLTLSLRNGFAFGDMSITERFFAGGAYTFRGTGIDKLGPIDTGTGEPKGGNAMVLLNLETTFPILIFPFEDIYYSIFADVGNIFWKANDFDFNDLEKAVGIGIKYKSPIGLLRADLAYAVLSGEEGHFEFHIGIGNVF
jgi:outer membrane protein insertion porin family